MRSLGVFSISAYAPGCGDSGRGTATGSQPNLATVAVDPRVIPLGARLQIDGLPGVFYALDTGGAVLGNKLDRWLPDCRSAILWGRQQRQITLLGAS